MTSPVHVADFKPTHIVPQEGLPAWEAPDLSLATTPLDAFLPVQLLSRRGEWGEVLCSNGWSAWVDGRLLVAVPQPPPTAGRPLTRTEDPRGLLARSGDALERYRRAVEDLAAGRADTESFRRGTRGLRAGVVLDGEAAWVYDESDGRWMYCDGTRLTTYAVPAAPGARPGSGAGAPGGGPEAGSRGAGSQRAGETAAVRDPGTPDGGPASHAPTRLVGLPDQDPDQEPEAR
ncbi:hypothetical protein OHS33_04015 [Streptomyces sp. NBC_00536]|uniref:hypothetical protein n=1 Tax=Streptomyces sp. NBC_00536 TaxID=2975769 RepID=UPI002E80A17E|nr:hypothetical protein [Streptomyces sp. NBC_00536]WUC77574.1 hypothetical protein OHS33_04015 [Streptomyces sp. NBC_00536]